MQSVAHAALNIVLQHYKGKLESFEKDERGRLLLADLIGRPIDETLWEGATCQAIERWRKLVPEYVEVEMRKGTVTPNARTKEIFKAFRKAIFDRLRASVFERLGQALRLIDSYYATIMEGYPMGRKPTATRMHKILFLHTQYGVVELAPIRLELVRKLQRLAPEMGGSTIEATTENCSQILADLVMNLNGRARHTQNGYGDVIERRNEERVVEDRRNGDDSSETEDSDVDTDDDPEVSLARPMR